MSFEPSVVKFSAPVGDIVAGLRHMIDRIEAGEFEDLRFMVAVLVDTKCAFTTFSWGQASFLEVIGALARAVKGDLVDWEK